MGSRPGCLRLFYQGQGLIDNPLGSVDPILEFAAVVFDLADFIKP
jgi:hypothetical protein